MAYQHLGKKARDKITGFEGTVMGHCEYLTGCNQTLLVPAVNKDGSLKDGHWFDDQRVEIKGGEAVSLDNGATPGPDKPAPLK